MALNQHGHGGDVGFSSKQKKHSRQLEESASDLPDLLADLANREPGLYRRLCRHLEKGEAQACAAEASAPIQDEPFMIGESPPMLKVFKAIRRFASTDAPILITGDSGTGKELAAQAIHERSPYAAGPFVPINCAGLPPSLISTELFGHERGAFTGAVQRKIGRIEAAGGGTVFLDEIGDMPMELQPHLLRFLQERTIERVGGHTPISVDVRVVAATNKNISREIEAGRFRQDLFFRLNVLSFEMPPLRDRGIDIELIAKAVLKSLATDEGGGVKALSNCARDELMASAWPGNVRELISQIRRGIVMADGDLISAADLGMAGEGGLIRSSAANGGVAVASDLAASGISIPVTANQGHPLTLEEAKAEVERALVGRALSRNSGNITAASRELGVSRVTLYRMIERYNLRPSEAAQVH